MANKNEIFVDLSVLKGKHKRKLKRLIKNTPELADKNLQQQAFDMVESLQRSDEYTKQRDKQFNQYKRSTLQQVRNETNSQKKSQLKQELTYMQQAKYLTDSIREQHFYKKGIGHSDIEDNVLIGEVVKQAPDQGALEEYMQGKSDRLLDDIGIVKPKVTFTDAIVNRAESRIENVYDIKKAQVGGEQSGFETALQLGGQSAGMVGDVLGEAMVRGAKGLRSITPKFLKDPLSSGAEEVLATQVVQDGLEQLSKGVEDYNAWADDNPRAARNLGAVANIGELAVDLLGGKAVTSAGKAGVAGTAKVAGMTTNAAGKITGSIGGAIENVATGVIGKTTGTSPDTIRQAVTSAGTKDFTDGLRGKFDEGSVLESTQKAIQSMKDNRGTIYGKGYESLLASEKVIDTSNIKEDLGSALFGNKGMRIEKMLNEAGEEISDLDFSKSTLANNSPQKAVIQSMWDEVNNRPDNSPAGLDVLRKRIDDYYKGTPEYGQSDRIATKLRGLLNKKIISEVPEYAEMNARYAEISGVMKDIEGALSLGKKAQTSTAITKLKGVLRRNQEFRQTMVKELNKFADGDLLAKLAGVSLNETMPNGIVGALAAGSMLVDTRMSALLTLGSPRLMGELANALGVHKKFLEKVSKNVRNILGKTTDIVSNASQHVDALPFDVSTAGGVLMQSEED